MDESYYEKNQHHNALITWLHSLRFKSIIEVFKELETIITNRPINVIDIGCAHAKLFDLLRRKQFNIQYTGIEIDKTFFDVAQKRYSQEPNFTIIQGSATNLQYFNYLSPPDIVVALETMEHIPEHDVVRIIENIARVQPRIFVCSVPVEIGPAICIKNVASFLAGYTRHKEYLWYETFLAGLYQIDKLPPHGTGHKGFDWRWLAQTIRHNMKIRYIRKFPFQFMPAGFSTTVFMLGVPRT